MKINILPKILNRGKSAGSCHTEDELSDNTGIAKVAIVGTPNVGKSVIFNRLTGRHATISNYPGTTVTMSRGKIKIADIEMEIVDTPGMYSLLPITEEERVARSILLEEKPNLVMHVVDGKNLGRMLPFTMQLIEAELNTLLVLNMMDETEAAGIEIDINELESQLGIPVVSTVATRSHGIDNLKIKIEEAFK
ncbi:MAG: GTP-binding protein [Chloroflexi bacterium]|mgnify:CR=1 FL=1|nr:GTP-binding protein [Chloroflexota bacterium]MBT7079920.1 GTP-binding protein [Chloroflexota bacterium]MBT7290106.1 GTP-binding protein [Chloroflexota bacterium]